jgi:hypothetical protein
VFAFAHGIYYYDPHIDCDSVLCMGLKFTLCSDCMCVCARACVCMCACVYVGKGDVGM